jgi:hypothetical protein
MHLEQAQSEWQQRMTSNLVRNRHDRCEVTDFPRFGRKAGEINHASGDWNDESILFRESATCLAHHVNSLDQYIPST